MIDSHYPPSPAPTRATVTNNARAWLGFILGLAFMATAVTIFFTSNWDFEGVLSGVRAILSGINPWAPNVNVHNFHNLPQVALFLWPMLFMTPRILVALGGALLIAVAFYQKAWFGLAWFTTNILLYLIAAGNIAMFIIGGGLLLLFAADARYERPSSLALRVLAYGLLMVKPQGAIFIVSLYVLLRRDWKGALIAVVLYGLLFAPLYPEWIRHLMTDPPRAQDEAAQSLWGKFGPFVAVPIAVFAILARRWKYWQVGRLLAGILAPYARDTGDSGFSDDVRGALARGNSDRDRLLGLPGQRYSGLAGISSAERL